MKRIIYDVPRFSTFLHREARDLPAASEHDAAFRAWEDEVFDRLYAGPDQTALPEGERDPRLAGWAQRFHEEAARVPAWQRFAADCQGDALAAAIATEHLSAALAPERQPPEPKQTPGQQKPANGSGSGAALARARAGGGLADAMRRQILLATGKAERAVDEARDATVGLSGVGGWAPGSGPGEAGGAVDVEQVKRLIKALRQNPRLRKIADLAGRMRRIAATKRRQKVQHGADEINDVEQGSDLARLLPSETVKLRHPTLRLLLLRQITERQALQYRLEGRETKGKGPVVVLVDKSGSMEGARDTWATAVALAVLAEAQRERRAFALIPFDHHVKAVHVVTPGATLPEDALFYAATGGTCIASAMRRALDVIGAEPGMRKADVVLITDGGSSTGEAADLKARAEALNANVIGIAIDQPASALSEWAHQTHGIVRLDTLEDAAAEALFGGKEE